MAALAEGLSVGEVDLEMKKSLARSLLTTRLYTRLARREIQGKELPIKSCSVG